MESVEKSRKRIPPLIKVPSKIKDDLVTKNIAVTTLTVSERWLGSMSLVNVIIGR